MDFVDSGILTVCPSPFPATLSHRCVWVELSARYAGRKESLVSVNDEEAVIDETITGACVVVLRSTERVGWTSEEDDCGAVCVASIPARGSGVVVSVAASRLFVCSCAAIWDSSVYGVG